MEKEIIQQFYTSLFTMNDIDFLYSIIMFNIAPVISSNKPASILTFTSSNRNLKLLWSQNKSQLMQKLPIKTYELYYSDHYDIVMFYSASILTKTLAIKEHNEFLLAYGYPASSNVIDYLNLLGSHFSNDFPHEIGIFLGIPITDVIGFINHSGKDFLVSGYWKVYGNLKQALTTFEVFDRDRIDMLKALPTTCKLINNNKMNHLYA